MWGVTLNEVLNSYGPKTPLIPFESEVKSRNVVLFKNMRENYF